MGGRGEGRGKRKERHTPVVTFATSFNPLITSTVFPLLNPPTTCPPVTLVKLVFVNNVGTNCVSVVKAVDGKEPFSTWYWRRAVTMEGSFEAATVRNELA